MRARMLGNIGFVEDIASLVTDQERTCMMSVPRGAFDLRSWKDVAPRASLIMQHLKGENGLALMPPNGWPQYKIDTYSKWVDEGVPKVQAERYSSFFRSIDAQTEYFDVYGSQLGLENMTPFFQRFFGQKLLRGVWIEYFNKARSTPILTFEKQQLWNQVVAVSTQNNTVKEGLLKIDEWLCSVVDSYFLSNGTLDSESLFDAFASFGADRLPPDDDRTQRIRDLNLPNDTRLNNAQYHRMDTREMWFYWFGHLQCTRAALGNTKTPHDSTRNALLAALFVGQTVDTAYRPGSNGKTRPAYTGTNGKNTILDTAKILLGDWDLAANEMQELYWMWKGIIPVA